MSLPVGVWRSANAGLAQQARPLLLAAGATLDKASLLQALAEALQFPDYFGHNWDAAWDCLTALDWPPGDAIALLLPLEPGLAVDDDDLALFIDLLAEAAEHWQSQRRQLTLLLLTERHDLPCLAGVPELSGPS